MTALCIFLLGLLVLLLSPFLRQLLGAVVWLLVAAWAYGHYLAPV
jgi:hypothetical protein